MNKENLGTRPTKGGWMTILELMELKELLTDKKKQGKVGPYELKFDYLPDDKVWYMPLDKKVPCGYTSLKRVTAKIEAIMEMEGSS